MASPNALSSVTPASTSSLTPVKSVAPVAAPAASAAPTTSAPTANAAPTASAPATNVTQPISAPTSSIQHASTTQTVKSTPTGTTSPSNNQTTPQNTNTHSNPSSGGTSNTPTVSSKAPSSGSHSASIGGAIFAILFVLLVLAGSFWFLRRRRERFRRLWEAQRMPASNFGKYENDIKPENQVSIEATLAADLARLRNLDQQASMNVQNYNRQFSEPTFDFKPKPVSPGGFKIARKPSYRVKNPVLVLPPSTIADVDVTGTSPTAPAYDAKEYIADSSSRGTGISTPPTITSTPH